MISDMKIYFSIVLILFSFSLFGEDGASIFNTKCIACHTHGGGKKIGPDLKGVTKRRKEAWIKNMILDPDKMLKTDPIAKKLLKEHNNVPMIKLGLSEAEALSVIEFLKQKDK